MSALSHYFIFADELRSLEPVIAYWCDYVGVKQTYKAMKTVAQSAQHKLQLALVKKFIDQKVKSMEDDKANLASDQSLTKEKQTEIV